MTARITIERISQQAVRVSLTADIEISVNADLARVRASAGKAANRETFSPGTSLAAPGYELLTVEETAELLHVGRDNVYYLLRTGQLRSIKIGKLRRIPRARIAELVARLESQSA